MEERRINQSIKSEGAVEMKRVWVVMYTQWLEDERENTRVWWTERWSRGESSGAAEEEFPGVSHHQATNTRVYHP